MSSATSNKSLKRKIVIFSGNDNLSILMLNNDIKQVQKSINKNTKKLRSLLGVSLPNIDFTKDSTSNSKEGTYRIIVVSDLSFVPKDFKFNNQSHIIIALYTPNKSTIWREDTHFKADAIVNFSSALELSFIIQDVAMDIQLSHYYQLVTEDIYSDKEISRAKVNFSSDNKKLNYISLATGCRFSDKYNFTQYLEVWNKFSKFYTPVNKRYIDIESLKSIKKILQSHPQYGQISVKKFRKLILNLRKGDYILVRTTKKPKNTKMEIHVLSQFGIRKWKTGKIKVDTINKFWDYYRYNNYLSIFKFSIR